MAPSAVLRLYPRGMTACERRRGPVLGARLGQILLMLSGILQERSYREQVSELLQGLNVEGLFTLLTRFWGWRGGRNFSKRRLLRPGHGLQREAGYFMIGQKPISSVPTSAVLPRLLVKPQGARLLKLRHPVGVPRGWYQLRQWVPPARVRLTKPSTGSYHVAVPPAAVSTSGEIAAILVKNSTGSPRRNIVSLIDDGATPPVVPGESGGSEAVQAKISTGNHQ